MKLLPLNIKVGFTLSQVVFDFIVDKDRFDIILFSMLKGSSKINFMNSRKVRK